VRELTELGPRRGLPPTCFMKFILLERRSEGRSKAAKGQKDHPSSEDSLGGSRGGL
jgi:hypothetical protein